jgi:hypothetical protein
MIAVLTVLLFLAISFVVYAVFVLLSTALIFGLVSICRMIGAKIAIHR